MKIKINAVYRDRDGVFIITKQHPEVDYMCIEYFNGRKDTISKKYFIEDCELIAEAPDDKTL